MDNGNPIQAKETYMSDSNSQSPQPKREGFERRWIKNSKYAGPERRSGGERRRHPPVKTPVWTDTDSVQETDSAQENTSAEKPSPTPAPPGKFKPYRP